MKQFRILTNPDNVTVLISVNKPEFADFLQAGYIVTHEGNRKELELVMELEESDGALCD